VRSDEGCEKKMAVVDSRIGWSGESGSQLAIGPINVWGFVYIFSNRYRDSQSLWAVDDRGLYAAGRDSVHVSAKETENCNWVDTTPSPEYGMNMASA